MKTKEKKRKIPKNIRASLDESDERGFALLQKNDEQQKTWAENLKDTYVDTPKARERAKAAITIQALENQQLVSGILPEQREILAEAYATTGYYNKARDLTASDQHRAVYAKYWEAVHLDDDKWCDHPENRKFVTERVFSVRDGEERDLLACGICGGLNVADSPEFLKEAHDRRAAVLSNRPKDMSIADSLRWHQQNVKI